MATVVSNGYRDQVLQVLIELNHGNLNTSSLNDAIMYDQGQIPKQTLSFPLFGGDSSEEFFIWHKTVKNKINFLQWGDEIFLRFLPTILKDRALHYYEHLDK